MFAYLRFHFITDLRILPEIILGILTALPDLLSIIRIPGP